MAEAHSFENIASPALLFDPDVISRNIARMIEIAGTPSRLRPHIKTHKCLEVLKLQIDAGISRVKCATIAEAELSAIAGVPDILIAYPLVGPNVDRFLLLRKSYPNSTFSTLVDSFEALEGFRKSDEAPFGLFVDLDCGMRRTGISPGPEALNLVRAISSDPALHFCGVHAYDGHIHDASPGSRRNAFGVAMRVVDTFIESLQREAIQIPLIVSGGSPTFALHAERAAMSPIPWQCSPGTTVLWDAGYGEKYRDLPFEVAALLLARVISHPGPRLICLDLGHKSVAAENCLERRVRFPSLPENIKLISQSEEHLVIELPEADTVPVGTCLTGIPIHICPTVALHQEARIVRNEKATGERWSIAARDRRLSI